MIDGQAMLGATIAISCVGIALQSLELVGNRAHLRDGHLLGWRPSRGGKAGPVQELGRTLLRYPACLVVLCVRIGAALLAAVSLQAHPAAWLLLPALVLLQLYYNYRFALTRENANAMYLYVLVACAVAAYPGASDSLVAVAFAFLSYHVLLAYFMSGKTKLASPRWRAGDYLTWICQNRAAQLFPGLGDLAGRHPRAVRVATWCVILLQLLFPLSLFLPAPVFWAFLAGGVIFHTAVSLTMGPHAFWWSFVATYPGLIFIHGWLRAGEWFPA